jgi:GDPmannose 4,6-dehydratase
LKTLITGITGQDGSYLAEQLLARGHKVYGFVRRTSTPNFSRIKHILGEIEIVWGDLSDDTSIRNAVKKIQPDYIYNLGAQSFVGHSFNSPQVTTDVNAGGVLRFLEAIKEYSPHTRFYQASTSEMFGKVFETPQTECTRFHPRSPYGISKCAGYWFTKHYREAYNLFATNGILFNHESERRGLEFVTRKITRAAAAISLGLQEEVRLGNLEAHRDWGYAPDYMEAAQLILEADEPDDYVVGTGVSHSVKELAEIAFNAVGLYWLDYVVVDPMFYRPAEVETLLANPFKIKKELGWEPKVSFTDMVNRMVRNDNVELKRDS